MNTLNRNFFTAQEACELLDISRPTLNAYRKKHSLKETMFKGHLRIDKLDLLQKIYLPSSDGAPRLEFVESREFRVEDCEVISKSNVFDIRLIDQIDSFGAICLLCCLKERVNQKQFVYVLVGKNSASRYLHGIRFFHEFQRVDSQYIQVDDAILNELDAEPANVILPLHLIGYKGREKAILSDIYQKLKEQGFSEELRASLGWTLGELADNATTHAGGLCYFMLASEVRDRKFLMLTIGDVGVGIPGSLRKNTKYEALSDMKAFVSAFKSDVSSWEDFHRRGKGLNDLLGIAKGNRACIRAESDGLAIRFDFRPDHVGFETLRSGTTAAGTRYCMVIIDSTFDAVSKKELDSMLNEILEKL